MGKAEAASDVYSLGVIAWEMLAGARPFDSASPFALPELQRKGVGDAFYRLRPDLGTGVGRLLARALAFDAARRPAPVTAFTAELADALQASAIDSRLARLWVLRRSRRWMLAGGATALVGAAAGGWWLRDWLAPLDPEERVIDFPRGASAEMAGFSIQHELTERAIREFPGGGVSAMRCISRDQGQLHRRLTPAAEAVGFSPRLEGVGALPAGVRDRRRWPSSPVIFAPRFDVGFQPTRDGVRAHRHQAGPHRLGWNSRGGDLPPAPSLVRLEMAYDPVRAAADGLRGRPDAHPRLHRPHRIPRRPGRVLRGWQPRRLDGVRRLRGASLRDSRVAEPFVPKVAPEPLPRMLCASLGRVGAREAAVGRVALHGVVCAREEAAALDEEACRVIGHRRIRDADERERIADDANDVVGRETILDVELSPAGASTGFLVGAEPDTRASRGDAVAHRRDHAGLDVQSGDRCLFPAGDGRAAAFALPDAGLTKIPPQVLPRTTVSFTKRFPAAPKKIPLPCAASKPEKPVMTQFSTLSVPTELTVMPLPVPTFKRETPQRHRVADPAVDRDRVSGRRVDEGRDAGGRLDRHALGDRHGAVAAGVEDDGLAVRVELQDRAGEGLAGGVTLSQELALLPERAETKTRLARREGRRGGRETERPRGKDQASRRRAFMESSFEDRRLFERDSRCRLGDAARRRVRREALPVIVLLPRRLDRAGAATARTP